MPTTAAACRLLAVALGLELALPATAAAPPSPTSLTVSGGVSLGAYEAGFLYYTLAANQASGGAAGSLKLATGASAGGVNSLLALRYACGGLPQDPRQSLFARIWLPLGFRELFGPATASALGAFSRSALEASADLVGDELAAGLPASCDVVLGIAVTRVRPRDLPLAGGRTSIPRTVEKFVLRIQGRGEGRPPRVTNYLELDTEDAQPALPEEPDGSIAFARVRDLLLASSAFPVAFPPMSVAHCMVVTKGKSPPFCPASAAREAPFLDGGVFDNDPLRLAAWVAAGGLAARPSGLAWREGGRVVDGRLPVELSFAFVSADARTYPEPASRGQARQGDSLPGLLGEELTSFISTARSKELDLLLSEYPHVAEGLVYPQRHYPAASEPMFAFFGFFDRAFREFDFALGMYEGHRHWARFTLPRLTKRDAGAGQVLPEATPGAQAAGAAWRPYFCLEAVLDGVGNPGLLCAGDDLAQFRVVLQTSLDRLWNDCRPVPGMEREVTAERACAPILAGAAEPRVPGVAASPGARRDDESATAYAVRLLASYGFDWRDMGYGRVDASGAMVGLRHDLGQVGEALGQAQPDLANRTIVGTGATLGADFFYYLPAPTSVWALLGRALELGSATSVVPAGWLRLGGAMEFQNLTTALSSDPVPISLLPVAGAEFLPAALGNAFVQGSFLARAGYLFRLSGGADCSGKAGTQIGGCSRPEVEAGAAATLAAMLRVQVLAQWYPPARGAPGLWAVAPSMGVQLSF